MRPTAVVFEVRSKEREQLAKCNGITMDRRLSADYIGNWMCFCSFLLRGSYDIYYVSLGA